MNASPIYRILWEEAVAILPPLDPPTGSNVEVFYTATDLVSRLNGSRNLSNVRNELRFLERWGWIKTRSGTSRRYLGRRKDNQVFFLMADLVGHAMTGEERLVSREVLGVKLDNLPEVTEAAVTRTGAARKHVNTGRPDGDGGALDQLG